jgi:hypothetical protein
VKLIGYYEILKDSANIILEYSEYGHVSAAKLDKEYQGRPRGRVLEVMRIAQRNRRNPDVVVVMDCYHNDCYCCDGPAFLLFCLFV